MYRFTGKRWARRKLTCKHSGVMFLLVPPQTRKFQFKTRQVKCFCKVENSTFTWKCLEEHDINDSSSHKLSGEIKMNGIIFVDKLTSAKYMVKIKNEESFPYIKIQHEGLELKFFCETEEKAETWKACIQGCCLGFEASEAKLNANINRFFANNQWQVLDN